MPVAGAEHTGTVRAEARGFSSVTREAHLTKLPSVSHRTRAGLHPSCGDPRPRMSACQGDIIQIASTCVWWGKEDHWTGFCFPKLHEKSSALKDNQTQNFRDSQPLVYLLEKITRKQHLEQSYGTWCCCCCCEVASVMSDSVRPHRRQPTRLPHPWDSPGKNTGVGCHFLLQCMQVKSESEVAQSFLTQQPHVLQPTRLLRPWDFSGKSTGVGCHCLLLFSYRSEKKKKKERVFNG